MSIISVRPFGTHFDSAERPGGGLTIRWRCSDRSNVGEPLDWVLVVPADGGFPCGPSLRGDVVRRDIETGSVCWASPSQGRGRRRATRPIDQRDPICGHADVARVEVAVNDAGLTSDEPRPRCSPSSNALGRHRVEVDPRPGRGVQEVGRRSPARALRPALGQPMQLAERVGTQRQSASVSAGPPST